MPLCLLAAGSNLGDSPALLDLAQQQLRQLPLTHIVAASSAVQTSAVGGPPGQESFLNSCFLLDTTLGPQQLLRSTRQIEERLGRVRRERWGPRPIDLDLLLYDNLVIEMPGLQIPHPRMSFRSFVLEPACQVAPDMQHPLLGATLLQLKTHLSRAARYLAIAGTGAWELARKLENRSDVFAAHPLDPSEAESGERLTSLLAGAGQQWVVTAGWCDQLLWAEPTGVPLQLWSRLRRLLPDPRLVVVIEPQDREQLAAWRAIARRAHRLPLLALPAGDPDGQMIEIEAALEAAESSSGTGS